MLSVIEIARLAAVLLLPIASLKEHLNPLEDETKAPFSSAKLNVSERHSSAETIITLYFIVDSTVKPAFGLSVPKYVRGIFTALRLYMEHKGNHVVSFRLVGIQELDISMTESLLVNALEHNVFAEEERVLLPEEAIRLMTSVYRRNDKPNAPHAYIVLTGHPIYSHWGIEFDAWASTCSICSEENYVFVRSTGYFQEMNILKRNVLRMIGAGWKHYCFPEQYDLFNDIHTLPALEISQCIKKQIQECVKHSTCKYVLGAHIHPKELCQVISFTRPMLEISFAKLTTE
uniref:Putative metalloprotease n=1 Tax=Ixodes ricinus TaxID=34613 RepID=A0A0K8R6U2_IXORI